MSAGILGRGIAIGAGLGAYTHVVNAGDWNGDGYQDVIARTTGERLLLLRGTSTGALAAGVDIGLVSNHRSITSIGDVNGDRYPDLVVINTAGNLYLVYGNGRTGYASFRKLASGWGARDWLRSPGDFNGDRRSDLITKVGDTLYLHRGTATNFAAPVILGTGWNSLAAITSIGDYDGDGRADLIARTTAGSLRLYRGDGQGRLLTPTSVSGSFAGTRFAL